MQGAQFSGYNTRCTRQNKSKTPGPSESWESHQTFQWNRRWLHTACAQKASYRLNQRRSCVWWLSVIRARRSEKSFANVLTDRRNASSVFCRPQWVQPVGVCNDCKSVDKSMFSYESFLWFVERAHSAFDTSVFTPDTKQKEWAREGS